MAIEIQCPYCYETFKHDEVLFRAPVGSVVENIGTVISEASHGEYVAEEDVENNYSGLSQSEIEKIKAEIERERPFIVTGKSEKFRNFWEGHRFANAEEPEPKNEGVAADFVQHNFDLPLLDPKNEKVTKRVEIERIDGEDFVYGMIDAKDNETTSRVCPHCNNPLQGRFGKHPVKHVCVIGIKGSGKTVFLSQLLYHMSVDLGKFGINVGALNTFVSSYRRRNRIEIDEVLPRPTIPRDLEQPLAVDMTANGKTITFVFHDIAGENCIGDAGAYANFIRHADALVFLIDPRQMEAFGVQDDAKEDNDLGIVFNNIAANYPEVKTRPVAAVISQIDRPECRMVMQSNCPTLYTADIAPIVGTPMEALENPQFNAKEYNTIWEFLSTLIGADPTVVALAGNYSNYGLFGISAIGADVIDGKPTTSPTPYRISEPLLWILKEMGLIGTNAPVRPKLSTDEYCKKAKSEFSAHGIHEGGIVNCFVLDELPYGKYRKIYKETIYSILNKMKKETPIDEQYRR